MNKQAAHTRRSFLKAVGIGAAALPFFSMLENSAIAQVTGELPLNFVGMAYYHAKPARYYYRRPGESDTLYDLDYEHSVWKPLAKYQNKLTIFEGFGYGVGQGGLAGESYIPMHGALGCFLTGSASRQQLGDMNFRLQNASLDHYLAQKFGGDTAFRSLEMTVEADLIPMASSNSISAGENGVLKTRLASPEEIWNKTFKSFAPPMGDAEAAAAAARRAKTNASILDYLAKDITRLSSRLAGTEKRKLDQHLTAVRDIERRLQTTPIPSPGCMKPPLHAEDGTPSYKVTNLNNGAIPYVDMIADFQIELLAQLLICGLTRFSTLVFAGTSGGPTDNATTAWGPDMTLPVNFHDEIAHVSESSIAIDQQQASMCRYYHSKVAKLMDLLDAAGALDNTLILVGNEGGHGSGHGHTDMPLFLCGGANGRVRMGRRILAPGRTAPQAEGDEPGGPSLTSHNPILVGIANAFGDPIESYGTCAARPTFTQGISGLLT